MHPTQFNRTKIIATLGPVSETYQDIKDLVNAGVDVCRINFSHGSHAIHKKKIDAVHKINKDLKLHIALLADLQGPKLRVGEVKDNAIVLEEGKNITISTHKCLGTDKRIFVDYDLLAKDVAINDRILIDDGKIMLQVLSTNKKDAIEAKIVHGGILSSKKGFNLPDTKVSQSSVTEKDKEDLAFILENRFQWIALSFVRSADDIKELRQLMAKYKHVKKQPLIIAKIEKPEAIADIDNIIAVADGIMVARGDLGIEVPLENVPLLQKMIVKKCLFAAKPIIVATQMMESMIQNYSPTRAEVNDVANSVMDGADAVMLSGETSVGKYPVKVIDIVSKIINQVESFEGIYYKENLPDKDNENRFITDNVIYSACILAKQVNAKAIISMTHSGYSAIKLSSHRPMASVLIFTNNHSILSKLSLVWGVTGFYYDSFESTDKTIDDIKNKLKREGHLLENDVVINLASIPIEAKGKINMVKLSQIA